MRRIDVDADEIVRLYLEEGLRGREIAARIGCGAGLVYDRLRDAGVRPSRWARLDRDHVIERYQSGESAASIARGYEVSSSTISRHLRLWGVPARVAAERVGSSERRPCPRDVGLRAYLLGFAWGDLAVDGRQGSGTTIAVRGSTTKEEQVDLVKEVFGPFGMVTVGRSSKSMCVRASLDLSFEFLTAKYGDEVPSWIRGPVAEAAFAAGYIDAEGSFGVYGGRARFKLDSCDEVVHLWLASWLQRIGVRAMARCIERAGIRSTGLRLSNDLYRVNVNDALSLRRLVATIEPFSRHRTRRATMAAAAENVADRMRPRAHA